MTSSPCLQVSHNRKLKKELLISGILAGSGDAVSTVPVEPYRKVNDKNLGKLSTSLFSVILTPKWK